MALAHMIPRLCRGAEPSALPEGNPVADVHTGTAIPTKGRS